MSILKKITLWLAELAMMLFMALACATLIGLIIIIVLSILGLR